LFYPQTQGVRPGRALEIPHGAVPQELPGEFNTHPTIQGQG